MSSISAKEYIELVATALHQHADQHRAKEMKAYLRNQFEFFGIQTPLRRSILKQLPKPDFDSSMLLQIANGLWKKPEREHRYMACDLLASRIKVFSIDDLPAFKKLLQIDAWWETVDSLSGIIGDIVLQELQRGHDSQRIMDTWLQDSDFWVRRSAMIHQLGWRLQTDTERLSHYALTLASETEFFIRKSIGWAFRDYAKWNPNFVDAFFKKHDSSFANMTVREALKNISRN